MIELIMLQSTFETSQHVYRLKATVILCKILHAKWCTCLNIKRTTSSICIEKGFNEARNCLVSVVYKEYIYTVD